MPAALSYTRREKALVEADGHGSCPGPDEADELAIKGDAPLMRGGLGGGVDIEAGEEAVDAVVGEAALAEETDLFLQDGVDLGFGGRDGVGSEGDVSDRFGRALGIRLRGELGIRDRDVRFLLWALVPARRWCAGRYQELYRHQKLDS